MYSITVQGITRSFMIIWDYRYKNWSNFRVSRPPKLWKALSCFINIGLAAKSKELIDGRPCWRVPRYFAKAKLARCLHLGTSKWSLLLASFHATSTVPWISSHIIPNKTTYIYIYVTCIHITYCIHTKGVGMGVLHVMKLLSAFSPSISKRPCLRRPRCGAAPRCLHFKSHQEGAMWCNGSIPHSLSAW